MISYVHGNLFEAPSQTLVNTVNTVGVMGKGLALTFKQIYPEMFNEYRALCESGRLKVGSLYLYRSSHKLVLNFPTKEHWRNPSRLEYIEKGLRAFVGMYERAGIHSIAFPPLGCGNGELDFAVVRPLMERYLADLPIPVLIYAPLPRSGVPEHRSPGEIAAWLRESPRELSFDEVWGDLRRLLSGRRTLETLSRAASFAAEMVDDGAAVRVVASGRIARVEREEFYELWRELREFGVLTPRSVPARRENVAPYILGIFVALSYVQPMPLADDYDTFRANPQWGVQLAPGDVSPPANRDQAELALA